MVVAFVDFAQARPARIAAASSAGFSSEIMCGAPSITSKVAPGMAEKPRISDGGVDVSFSPAMMCAGTRIDGSSCSIEMLASDRQLAA